MIQENEKNYDFLKTSLLVVASALLFLTVGSYVQHKGFALGVVVTEYAIVMLPVVAAGWAMKVDFKKALRLNPIQLKTVFKIIALAITALPTIYFANFMMVIVLIKMNRFYQVDIPIPKSAGELGVSFILIAFSAGLCEELMFRGMVMNAYEKRFGRFWAVLCPALIFGMFHFNPLNFFGPVILGVLFGYLVLSTNSIFSSMVAHMTNNGIALLFAFVTQSSPAASGGTPEAATAALEKTLASPVMLVTIVLVLLGFALMMAIPGYVLFKSIKKDCAKMGEGEILLIKGERYLVEAIRDDGLILQKLALRAKTGDSEPMVERFIMEAEKMKMYKPEVVTPLTTPEERQWPKKIAWAPIAIFLVMYLVIGTLILQRAAGH